LLAHPTASPAKRFQPSNINFSLFSPLERRMPKRERPLAYLDRARDALDRWLMELNPIVKYPGWTG
jgi:methylenetetrahydrofolate--tRNA-(uracil-5-)-methyltransferase